MDRSKLFQAFEKSKTQRQATENNTTVPVPRPVAVVQPTAILEDLVPVDTIPQRTAELTKLKNPKPMSVASMKKNKLIYSGMKNKKLLNAYRELRIQLKEKAQGGNSTILISSVASDTNSIVTALNLAISYSLDVKTSALVIDCNPHNDDLAGLVTADLNQGLTDYMDDPSIGLDAIIYPSGIERVNVIPAGSNHERAVELFSTSAMSALIYELKNRYSDRNIIINTPAVLSSSEARVLTAYCDLTVLTIPYSRARNADIEDAIAAIGADNVAGVVYQQ